MKLTIFQSDKGDCMLLTSSDNKNILADGGMRASFRDHVAGELSKLRRKGQKLDVVYVSHIDQDHISGILELADQTLDWKVFRFQRGQGNAKFPEPRDSKEPPEIASIWHNAFFEFTSKNRRAIEDQLAANGALLSLRTEDWTAELAEAASDLATSMSEAVTLSRRIGAEQLGIPLNKPANKKLMMADTVTRTIRVGGFRIRVIGPFKQDLRKLRKEWNKWLRSQKGRDQLRRIRERARRDEERLTADEFRQLLEPMRLEAAALGDREAVTTPNLASLMLLVKEGNRSVLMTGDGHCDDILKGLADAGALDANGRIHVDVLKTQHHGSEYNFSEDFCKRVTADHYVFCGNGAHKNPDLRVLKLIFDSRFGSATKRSPNALVGNKFKIWFNSSPEVTKSRYRNHMRAIQRAVAAAQRRSNGQMRAKFLSGSKMTLRLR